MFTLVVVAIANSHAQTDKSYNLDFEDASKSDQLPEGWENWGNYPLTTTKKCYQGAKALLIKAPDDGGSFGTAAYKIEGTFEADSIRLEGFIKLNRVSEGYAGLLLRIEGDGNTLAFDNMDDKKLSGTSDWKKYVIVLPYPKDAEVIYVGAMLVGKGEAWFDDLQVYLDGNKIQP